MALWLSFPQLRHIDSILVQCWAIDLNAGSTLTRDWVNVSCLLGGLSFRWDQNGGYFFACWTAQQPRNVGPMLNQRWATVYDAGPTLAQHRTNVLCMLNLYRICSAVVLCNCGHVMMCQAHQRVRRPVRVGPRIRCDMASPVGVQ